MPSRLPATRPLPPILATGLLAAFAFAAPAAAQAPEDAGEQVDAVFAEWDTATTPGCAVGVARDGLTVLAEAWGMADLEWGIPNTDRTVFENGSVSKQFTAAAVVLLALDGALALDDDIREYIPEVPDYGTPITITHLMNHTSGLRDWGSVAGMSGWGRGNRTHSHDHVLDIIARQTALNFEPGHEYSYSNSGYNLMAILVERVSGMSFADFSRIRIFEPVGMLDTQWRDDYRRIVPGRATAYSQDGETFEINQPIENVHGNGGLLTTVHDLLRWNHAAFRTRLFGDDFARLMQEQGVLNDGRTIRYARGLFVGESGGVPSVTHTGATSGYRAYLGRFPDHGLDVAVLCNVANVNPGGLGAEVADIYLGGIMQAPAADVAAVAVPESSLARWEGLWVEEQTGVATRVRIRNGELRWGGAPLHPISAGGDAFAIGASGRTMTFSEAEGGSSVEAEGEVAVDRYTRVEPVAPEEVTPGMIEELVGSYWAADAEFGLEVSSEEGSLYFVRRPGRRIDARPVYRDAWQSSLGLVRVLRGENGEVTGLSVHQSRVYDMRFERMR